MFFPNIKYTTQKRLKQLERDVGGIKYKTWRRAVLDRDDNKCQWPGCNKKTDLQVHHIQRWADAKHLRFNVYNGITLCKEHHIKIQGREGFYSVTFLRIVLRNSDGYQADKYKRESDSDNNV